jgi:hypothetical protein
MRLLLKATLVCAMALTAAAFMAPSASAQIEVTQEPSGNPCNLQCVTEIVSTSQVQLDIHLFGIEFTDSLCYWSADLDIYADGSGSTLFTPTVTGGSSCSRSACWANRWPFNIREDWPGWETMELTFCVQPSGGGDPIECSVDLDVDSHTHQIYFSAYDEPCHGAGNSPAELSGTFYAPEDDIEIAH